MSVSFDPNVTLTVEVAFTDDPLTETPTGWVDITSWVLFIDTFRGRRSATSTVSVGVATVVVDNQDGRFNPLNTTGPYAPNVQPLKQLRITAVHNSVTYRIWWGFIESWSTSYDHAGNVSTVTIRVADAFKILALVYAGGTLKLQERSDLRIGSLLDDAGWMTGWRDLSTGDVTIRDYVHACQPVLQAIRRIETTEAGLLFVKGNGDVAFRNRDSRSTAATVAVFEADPATINNRFDSLGEIAFDDADLWNRIEVTAEGGTAQVAENTASQTAFGTRTLKINDTLHVSDADAATAASTLLTRYKDPQAHVTSMTLKPQNDPTGLWPQALGREINDKIAIVHGSAVAGGAFTSYSFIEGVGHLIDPKQPLWITEFATSGFA